jgi:hypothetical protein
MTQGMVFGGTGAKIAPTSRGDNAGKGPSEGIAGKYILMWRGFALFSGGARLVQAVGDE